MPEGERRLAAIMYTDMVGYTALNQKSEDLAQQLLEMHRSIVRPFFPKHNGREVKTMGDSFLVEFASALEAVRCAFDIQQSMHEMNTGRALEKQIQLRIGVHLGDVIHRENDVYGDAVNIASRIEPLAPPGGICVTQQVYDHVRNKFEFPLLSLGRKELKNVGEHVEIFKVVTPWEEQTATKNSSSLPRDRIAILPFANMSPDPNDQYFADGMTEEIISTVSGIGQLSVISRTSVMRYKGTNKSVEEIGRELKAGSVLEGSFRKAGNRIRVTTQLIDVAEDKHLWAQSYDRNMDDVFEVQSDVAKQVADALRVKILSSEMARIDRKPTENATAYTLYLKGRSLWNKRGIEDLKQARGFFEQAVREDPDFASGYVGIADCSILLRNNWGLDREANLENAKMMLAKALSLDPSLAEAHATKGMVLWNECKLSQAEEEFRKAIELRPSYATAHQWYFQLLGSQLKDGEGMHLIEKALELDPLSPIINAAYGDYFFSRRDYRNALELYKRAAELGMVSAHVYMALAYGRLKMFPEMRREKAIASAKAKESFPMIEIGDEAFFAWMEDEKEKLKSLLPQLEAHLSQTGRDYVDLAAMYFHLGDKDKGFESLEKAYVESNNLSEIKRSEFFDTIRTDPRYLDLLKRLGLR